MFTTLYSFAIVSFFSLLPISAFAQSAAGNALELTSRDYFSSNIALDSIDELTIEAWVYPEDFAEFAYPVYVGKDTTEGFGFVVRTDLVAGEGYLAIMLGGVTLSATGNGSRLPLRQWSHIAITRGNSVWKLYKNGALVGRGKAPPLVPSTQINYGRSFSGMIDQIRIWRRERKADEILKTLSTPLKGTESGLLIYYPLDEDSTSGQFILQNRAIQTDSLFDAKRIPNGGGALLNTSTAPLTPVFPPEFSLSQFPKHLQFFPRDDSSRAIFTIVGSIDEQGYDSVVIQHFTNEVLVKRTSMKLLYNAAIAPIYYTDTVSAELARTVIRLYVCRQDTLVFLAEGADIVAGDVFLINGQSNAHPTVEGYTWQNPFARSFGIQTTNENFDPYDLADTLWGLSTATGWGEERSGPYLSGAWGQGLQERLIWNYGVPICIINGAAGGSVIEQHIRNNSNPMDISSIYGKLLYRTRKSGLANNVRAIFWYQGEYNYFTKYYENFTLLHDQWMEDFPNTISPHVYLMQIRPGCFAGDSKLREIQRTIPDSIPNITVMSSMGIRGHNGCHFLWYGYVDIAEMMYRILAHDHYGSTDSVDIEPPNVMKAQYADTSHTKIFLTFTNAKDGLVITNDTLVGKMVRTLKNYLYLDGVSGLIQDVFVSHDSLFCELYDLSQAKTITYLPDRTYEDDDTLIYQGPWLLNARGVGALSFADVPIRAFVPDTADLSTTTPAMFKALSMQCTPNPVTSSVNISYHVPLRAKVLLEILDVLGNSLVELENCIVESGHHQKSYRLENLGAGGYFLRLDDGNRVVIQKIIVVK